MGNSGWNELNKRVNQLEKERDTFQSKYEYQLNLYEKAKNEQEIMKRKIDDASANFHAQAPKILDDYITKLKETLNKESQDYFDSMKCTFPEEDLSRIVDSILINEKGEEIMKNEISKYEINLNSGDSTIQYLNILLLGYTGVGKSTLINSVLGLDKNNEAKTGEGQPVTKEINHYTSQTVSGMRLWDTRGIELGTYGINEVEKDIKEIITTKTGGNPDEFIHCIWYCVSGKRFQNCEKELLQHLMELYPDNSLPIIIVYTQSYNSKEANNMIREIQSIIGNRKIEIVKVVAKDYVYEFLDKEFKIEKSGVNELIKLTFTKVENAVKSACFASIEKMIKQKYQKEAEKKINNVMTVNQTKIDILLKDLNDKNKEENPLNYVAEIANTTLKNILFEHEPQEFSKKALSFYIETHIQKWFEKLLKEFTDKYIKDKEIGLTQMYIDCLLKIEYKYQVFFQIKENLEQWHEYSKNNIFIKLQKEIYCSLFSFTIKFICEQLAEKVSNYLLNEIKNSIIALKKFIEEKSKEIISKIIQDIFKNVGITQSNETPEDIKKENENLQEKQGNCNKQSEDSDPPSVQEKH